MAGQGPHRTRILVTMGLGAEWLVPRPRIPVRTPSSKEEKGALEMIIEDTTPAYRLMG